MSAPSIPEALASILTAQELSLLQVLHVTPSAVVSRKEIAAALYPAGEPPSNVLEVLVGRVRKALAEHQPSWRIVTRRGQGYELAIGGGA